MNWDFSRRWGAAADDGGGNGDGDGDGGNSEDGGGNGDDDGGGNGEDGGAERLWKLATWMNWKKKVALMKLMRQPWFRHSPHLLK